MTEAAEDLMDRCPPGVDGDADVSPTEPLDDGVYGG